MFLKNRELRVKMVKPSKDEEETTEEVIGNHISNVTGDVIKDVFKDVTVRAAITVGALVVGVKVLDILGEIAVKKTKSADNE